MMKTQVGLGVLSIPQAFNVLGLGPGVVCVTIIAAITTWSDYMVGVFKLNHPDVNESSPGERIKWSEC
jgi:amino acid permease